MHAFRALLLIALSSTAMAAHRGEDPHPGDLWTEPMTGMVFVWVPDGCFKMGCTVDEPDCNEDEFPAHEVCLEGYWIGRYEVTQAQWEEVMLDNPSHSQVDGNHPVENVSWKAAQKFIKDLTAVNDHRYRFRLPSEAQWEFACRSGGKDEKYAGSAKIDEVGWHWTVSESNKVSFAVGLKKPNGLGLYDMSGNVWEWTEDTYHDEAYQRHEKDNPVLALEDGACKVARGGGFHSFPRRARCSSRRAYTRTSVNRYTGFRLVRDRREMLLPPYTPPATEPLKP